MSELATKQRPFTNVLERMPSWVFFVLLFSYLLLFTFQGIDMADEGFNSIFFKQIYNDPATVQYSFMFWLAGAIGGAFEAVFPDLGLWGFRLLGAITMTGTAIVTYQLLKNHINKGHLKIGLILALIIINNNIRIFHYNYLCTFWFMIAVSLLFNGLKRNKLLLIFFAGGFVALEMFTRIPSLVNLGLVIGIFYYGYLNETAIIKQVRQAFFFFAGFGVTVAILIFFMKISGQLDIFLNAMKLVQEMGKGGAGGHYGLMKLIKQFFLIYARSLSETLLILSGIVAAVLGAQFVKKQWFYRKWLMTVLNIGVLILFMIMIVTNRIDHMSTLFVLSNFCLLAGVLLLTSNFNNDIKTLMLLGCYIILTYPLGSSDGALTVGIYTLWLALPIAVHYLLSIRTIENRLSVVRDSASYTSLLSLTGAGLNRIRNGFLFLAFFACLFQAYFYPFFDFGNRINMRYTIDNKYMKGIYTTKNRATAINELLHESIKYVKKDDRVLAYHSIPMFHYMTETKPYLRNSMPWLYQGNMFGDELALTASSNPNQPLPVIIVQLLKTVGDGSTWPDPPAKFDDNWAKVNETRDKALNEFLQKHQYKEVWKNNAFSIMIPPGMSVADSGSIAPMKP